MQLLEGTEGASTALVEHLWRDWLKMVRVSSSMGSLRHSEDHVHEVVARLVEKIGSRDGSGVRLFFPWKERHPGKDFGDWIRIVTRNVVYDYVREQMGATRVEDGEFSLKRILNEFSTSQDLEKLGTRPPMTAAQTARELMEFAQTRLPEPQYRALCLWLTGKNLDELAADLQLDFTAAEHVLRAGIASLRRYFAGSGLRS